MNNEMSTVQAILDGDTEKYAELMDGCASHVIKLVSRRIPASDVEMVVQESFVRAYDSLSSYSGRSPFINWISRIAIRSCKIYTRNQKKKRVEEPKEKKRKQWEKQKRKERKKKMVKKKGEEQHKQKRKREDAKKQ
eukprot:TRINITY_DN5269_c0_g1_i3.p1 TRINITY_DN5269_c0_g1~~TRINITY_DN5269_c0_g1_i3.p1  ORF type:complete len:136 (-),score=30.97 TRINITY_DN5269_c0_g1_i3:19-426(-)